MPQAITNTLSADGGQRAVVVEAGGDAGSFVRDAVDVDCQLPALRMCSVAASAADERAQRFAVGGAVVLEVQVTPA